MAIEHLCKHGLGSTTVSTPGYTFGLVRHEESEDSLVGMCLLDCLHVSIDVVVASIADLKRSVRGSE
jgi:hypothetical protein